MTQGTSALGLAITLIGVLLAGCGRADAPVTREAAVVVTVAPSPAATAAGSQAAIAPAPSPSPAPVRAANQQPPLATFQRYVDALNRGDVDGALAAFAADARLADLPRLADHRCQPDPSCTGHAAIRPELEARGQPPLRHGPECRRGGRGGDSQCAAPP
jgi:hypothetical protein